MSVFAFFSRDFRDLVGTRNPCVFGGSPGHSPIKTGRKDRAGIEIFKRAAHQTPVCVGNSEGQD